MFRIGILKVAESRIFTVFVLMNVSRRNANEKDPLSAIDDVINLSAGGEKL